MDGSLNKFKNSGILFIEWEEIDINETIDIIINTWICIEAGNNYNIL